MTFKNMKIEITDGVQLKAVCDVLQSMGYKRNNKQRRGRVRYVIADDDGVVTNWFRDTDFDFYKPTSLTDLLAMRDKQFMEKIHA